MGRTAAGILSKCALIQGLSAEAAAKVTRVASHRAFRRGELLFREGDPCPGIYAVGGGSVRLFKLSASGKEHLLHMATAGETFADVAAIGGFACPAYARAEEETECALIPQADLQAILRNDHGFCLEMLAGLARRVQRFVGLLEDVVLRDATARVARHLLEAEPAREGEAFRLALRKKDLASHLNLTSETVSRTLRRLIEAGLLAMHDREVRILDEDRLRAVAEGRLDVD